MTGSQPRRTALVVAAVVLAVVLLIVLGVTVLGGHGGAADPGVGGGY